MMPRVGHQCRTVDLLTGYACILKEPFFSGNGHNCHHKSYHSRFGKHLTVDRIPYRRSARHEQSCRNHHQRKADKHRGKSLELAMPVAKTFVLPT